MPKLGNLGRLGLGLLGLFCTYMAFRIYSLDRLANWLLGILPFAIVGVSFTARGLYGLLRKK